MPPLKHHLDSARLRSGVFALVFAPIALVFMGSSMTDVQSLTAAGQPLASVEGLIGLALASTLFALIAMNCDDSSAGMFVAFGWSLVIGAAQMAGYLQVPMLMKSPARPHDMLAAMSWSMYPVAMAAILAASAVTVKSVRVRAGETTRMPLARSHRSAFGASVALPAAAVVFAVYVYIAPNNSVRVAHEGLIGLVSSYEYHPAMALAGAGALAAMALSARWSITGTQLGVGRAGAALVPCGPRVGVFDGEGGGSRQVADHPAARGRPRADGAGPDGGDDVVGDLVVADESAAGAVRRGGGGRSGACRVLK